MKLTQIVVASMALFAVAQQAQAVTRMTGASATSINLVEALSTNNVCASNNVSVFKRGSSTSALGNNFTVKCNSGNFGTSGESEVQIDVTGGSVNAILFSAAGAAEPGAGNGGFLPSTTTGCTGVAGTGALSFLTGTKLKNCAAAAPLTTAKSVGGFMDVEPALFVASSVITGDYTASIVPATFSQVFGVAVSKDLYEALQGAQGLTVGIANATPANQPTISKAQLTSLINNIDFNDAKNLGPKFLVPTTTQTNLSYCRRPNTSGTQAAAEAYFLGNPGLTGALVGALNIHDPVADGAANVVVDNGTGNFVTFKMNSGSGNVRTCLNTAGFAFGFLSAENNPIGTTDTYRFIKLSQAEFAEGAAGTSQTATAVKGAYDYVFESVLFNPTGSAVLDLINASIKTGPTTPGVFLNINSATPESNFTRGGNSVAPYASN
ncbi:hypothetical protein [Aquabacterium sp.]|uniref:hypothetical protein n=1 Tax=Aquabacterium sp. TaxID=1872578 RepID=UPI002489E864|nr:hypothetical protein [Aquabacterium sp.]MDI1257890.1 hypothetical protein [Aquabacterium sp.]